LVIEWRADGADYRSLGTSAEPGYEHSWPLLHAILEQSEGPLTRRAILHRWPDSALAPGKLTVWKWLGRAVQEVRVLQDGRANRREPFSYQLPGMAEKWHERFLASLMKRLEAGDQKQRPAALEAPSSADNDATPCVPMARPDETMPLEPEPLHERSPEPAASASSSPVPSVPQTPDQLALLPSKASVRLPYPWNLMNPAEVPDEVWRRARGTQQNG
jgi:hypothetical protein